MSPQEENKSADIIRLNEEISKLTSENETLKQNAANLEKQLNQFVLVFNNSPEAIVFLDLKGNIQKINTRVQEWLGYPPEEVLGKNLLTLPFLSIKSKAIALKNFTDRLRGKELGQYELEFITASGELKIGRLSGQIIKNENGKIAGDLVMVLDITKQLKYENELRESRETFKTLTDTTESAIFIVRETMFQYINKFGERLFGYTLDELRQKHFWDIVHPEDRAMVKERGFARQRKENVPASYEFRIITKANETRWMHYTGAYLEFEGKPALIGNAFDITESKLSEEKLRDNFVKFQTIFNSSAFGIALVDLKGNIIDVNDSICKMFGYTANEMKILNFVKISHPEDAKNDAAMYMELLEGKISHYQSEKRYIKKDGTTLWANITVSLFRKKEGDPEYALGMVEDITEKKQMQEKLTREHFLFTTLMKHIPDSIYFKDEKSRFIAVNEATAKKMELDNPEQLIGKSDYDFFTHHHADQAFRDEQEMMKQNKSIIGAEEKETWRDGTVTWVSSTKIPLQNEKGETIGTFGISRDITNKKEIEEKLKTYTEELKQLNANKDRFFSILAHDLRSPFTALLGYSDIISTDYKSLSEDELVEFAGNINMVAKNVYGLLENLLDWSRIQTGRIEFKPEAINFPGIGKNVIKLFDDSAKNKTITLSLECEEEDTLFADENMLNTVLRNLVSNAIKFTRPGGEIKIKLQHFNEHFAQVSVIDNGVGISDKDKIKLFDLSISFTTTGTSKEVGTGLGLILCKELVEKNGGKIWVESKQGEGSSFNFTIPLTQV